MARRAPIQDLQTDPEPYVTVSELAEYWVVSRKEIYKQIDAGTLRAIKLGPRLLRIRSLDAIDFEKRAHMRPHVPQEPESRHQPASRLGAKTALTR